MIMPVGVGLGALSLCNRNSGHYSGLARVLGAGGVARLQEDFGAKVCTAGSHELSINVFACPTRRVVAISRHRPIVVLV